MTPELLSLVFPLHNSKAVSLAYDQGRALAAQFLDWVQAIDPSLSTDLHDSNAIPRPYTISNLYNLPKPKGGLVYLPAETEVWFRVTSLSPTLSLFLVEHLLSSLPTEMQIGKSVFTLAEPIWEPTAHPWAGCKNYDQLIKQHLLGNAHKRLHFEFFTATTFKTHALHIPYILPQLAIPSWLRSWNAYAPVTFPESLLEDIRSSVAVSYYKMRSIPVRYGDITLIGGIGKCTFNVVNPDPYWRHLVNVLSAFAFYCGTGVKTALGLGQTRRLGSGVYRGLNDKKN